MICLNAAYDVGFPLLCVSRDKYEIVWIRVFGVLIVTSKDKYEIVWTIVFGILIVAHYIQRRVV